MIRGMYSAVSGLRTHQMMIDVTSNNLANVNTVGYKGSRTTFKDQLQQTIYGGTAGGPNTGGTNAAQVGLGVQLGSIDTAGSASVEHRPGHSRRHRARALRPRRRTRPPRSTTSSTRVPATSRATARATWSPTAPT